MKTNIRVEAIAALLIASLLLASCQALTSKSVTTPTASPGVVTKTQMGACRAGSQDEPIAPTFGFKMTSPTSGWAVAQCNLVARPTFAGGSTIDCHWPPVEAMGILHTTDGGKTWIDVSPPNVPNRTWHHGQYFLDATHAWVAEVSRTADACVSQVTTYRTSDGGRTWQQGNAVAVKTAKPTEDIFNVGYYDVLNFVDPQHGWLLIVSPPNPSPDIGTLFQPSTLYATVDGGMHWRLVASTPGSAALSTVSTCRPDFYRLGGMTFTSATTGWLMLSCPAQMLVMTQDGGATWRPQALPSSARSLYLPTFFDSTHGIVTGDGSDVMLATSDGGVSWTQHQVPGGPIQKISFIDPNRGWLVAVEQQPTSYDTAVYRTTDGGVSWSLLGRSGFATITSIKNGFYPIEGLQFVNADVGFAALGRLSGSWQDLADTPAPPFQLLGTQDGGRSWKIVMQQVPVVQCGDRYSPIRGYGSARLSPVKLASATTAWARGGLRTTDGGFHWRDVSPAGLREGASTPLYPPGYTDFYLDGDHAWQAAIYGSATSCNDHVTAFATSDGGETWDQSKPVKLKLPSGYQVGAIQMGFSSSQSGWLWVPFGPRSSDPWVRVSITDVYLFRTSDGGLTWHRLATVDSSMFEGFSPTSNCKFPLGKVTFSSATVGWMRLNCANSQLFVSRDGGISWKLQALSCQGCYIGEPTFVDEQHGFVVVEGLMSTSDGGATWRMLPALPRGGYLGSLALVGANNLWGLVSPPTPPGWIKGSGGIPSLSLYRSTDGGQTWSLVQDGWPGGAYGLLFADDKNGMAYGSFLADGSDIELKVTSDGGHTWKVIKPAL